MSAMEIDSAAPRAAVRRQGGRWLLPAPILLLVVIFAPDLLGVLAAFGVVALALATGAVLAHRQWAGVVVAVAVLGALPAWWSASRPDESGSGWLVSWIILGLATAVGTGWMLASTLMRAWDRRSLVVAGALTALLFGTAVAVVSFR